MEKYSMLGVVPESLYEDKPVREAYEGMMMVRSTEEVRFSGQPYVSWKLYWKAPDPNWFWRLLIRLHLRSWPENNWACRIVGPAERLPILKRNEPWPG